MKKKVYIIGFILLTIDFISKIIVDLFLNMHQSIRVFEKFLYITKSYNTGISFGLLTNQRWVIIIFSIIVFIFLLFYKKRFKENKRNILAFALIYGGLLGNLVERIVHGYVTDFIDFYVFNYDYPIFNFADSFLVIGVCLLIYAIYKGEDNENSSK